MGTPKATFDEAGCLSLNVWTPDIDGSAPVLFWVHGGAWVSGSGGWDWYAGARLAATQDIVVVTINYRLGPLGYLYFRELIDDFGAGNFGLHDQIAALDWVVENIAGFGGDPDLITVGGQSAGAHSASMLAASPRTRRHVRRALLQSGGANELVQTPTQASDVARDFLDVLGIGSADAAELRRISADGLLDAHAEVAGRRRRAGNPILPLGVVADETAPAGDGRKILRRDDEPELDIMVGWTRDEFMGFARLDQHDPDRSTVLSALREQFGSGAPEVYEHYRDLRPESTPADLQAAISGDALTLAPMLGLARERASRGVPTYVYRFDWSASHFGACHCIDLPFTFGNLGAWHEAAMLGSADPATLKSLAGNFGDAIGAFVRMGSPGSISGVGDWVPYGLANRDVLQFDRRCAMAPGLGADEEELLERHART